MIIQKLKGIKNNIVRVCKKNPILYTFTKEYREEVKYDDFMKQHVDAFKLNAGEFDVTETVNRLKAVNFESNFKMPELGTKEYGELLKREKEELFKNKLVMKRTDYKKALINFHDHD